MIQGRIETRSLSASDISSCVDIHIRAFTAFFLTFLGKDFLAVLYRSIEKDVTGLGWIAASDNQILGFVIGSTQPGGLYSRLIRNNCLQFAWAAFPAFLHRPAILPRLLRAFSRSGEGLPVLNCGTLMSIAVAPEAQGKGVGKVLVREFLIEARKRGLEYVNLTTDARNNDATNAFYLAQGFTLFGSYTTPEGRQMNEYLFWLPELDVSKK